MANLINLINFISEFKTELSKYALKSGTIILSNYGSTKSRKKMFSRALPFHTIHITQGI